MARQIDAELLFNALKEEHKNGNFVFTSKWIKEIVENLPTADVAPKSEVVKTLSDIKRQIHEKAIYPHNAGIKPYISVREIDAIIEAEMWKHKGGEDHV